MPTRLKVNVKSPLSVNEREEERERVRERKRERVHLLC